MTLSPNLKITLLGDNDDIDPLIVSSNSTIMDTAAPVVIYSPLHPTDPQPNGRFDGDWRYNTLSQSLSRWNAALAEWQSIAFADGWRDPYAMRSKLLASHSSTGAATVTGGGAGLASVDLNAWSFSTAASGGLSGDYPIQNMLYVERGWFWWTGTPYPPTSKLYKAQIFANLGYKLNPSGSSAESISGSTIGPISVSPNVAICMANNTFGYNSDKMGCKVPYVLSGQFTIIPQDASSSVSIFVRSVFQTDSSQFPNTMTAGRSADALGSSKAYIYQLF